jgi:hypothetical protein
VTSTESYEAEIAWFVRGTTLYRRVLLILPDVTLVTTAPFYASNDLSVHDEGGTLVANSLADLTKPGNRFGHDPDPTVYPPHPDRSAVPWSVMRLPTLCECSEAGWPPGEALPNPALTATGAEFDAWLDPYPYDELDPITGAHSLYYDPSSVPATQRIGEDVILTNVIGFDVKAWDPDAPVFEHDSTGTIVMPGDPGYPRTDSTAFPSGNATWNVVSHGAYVDLDYANGYAGTNFDGNGEPTSQLTSGNVRVYDTWSFHYEHDGEDQGNLAGSDEGTNGFDDDSSGDDGYGIVDDVG